MKLQLIGIPTFSGAFYSGTELAPAHLRASGLMDALQQRGISAVDLGDLVLPDCLPRHNLPPVRNWPAPRMVWDRIRQSADRWFAGEGFPLILGGDCSIVTGTVTHLYERFGEHLYLLVVDAHVDVVKPDPTRCVGAAGMGLWFLAEENPFWERPPLAPDHMLVLACQNPPAETHGIRTLPLPQLRAEGCEQAAQAVLAQLPAEAKILVHFDVDALVRDEMPAAYAPSETGLTAAECQALLTPLLADPRTVGLEVTEFSALRDVDGSAARRLTDLLAGALAQFPDS